MRYWISCSIIDEDINFFEFFEYFFLAAIKSFSLEISHLIKKTFLFLLIISKLITLDLFLLIISKLITLDLFLRNALQYCFPKKPDPPVITTTFFLGLGTFR